MIIQMKEGNDVTKIEFLSKSNREGAGTGRGTGTGTGF
jgi:hypothetical protein